MGPGSWNRRLGPAALPDCPFANRSPGLFWMFWLFLQPNNSQCSNCQIRNTRISTASVTPMLGIRAKGQVDPSKADFGTCSTCFIWCTSGSVLSTTLLAVFAIYTQIIAIAPARPIAQRSPSALSRSSMRREHCGNFSVADIVMSGEVLQRAGSYPRPAPRAARCSVLPHSRGNCTPGHAVVLHARAAQIPKERYSKSVDSTSSHNSADFQSESLLQIVIKRKRQMIDCSH
jgi:hypothetical protein